MAVVTYSRQDLGKLMGRRLDDKTIQRASEMGSPIEELTGKEVSFEVFPNRPDLLSIEGFARAFGDFLSPKKRNYGFGKPKIRLRVESSVKAVRPHIVAAAARGIKLDEFTLTSLMGFQEKIHETLGRRRKKLSIGIYDLDKLKPPFTYKAASPGAVSFTPLDDTRELTLDAILEQHPKGMEYADLLRPHAKYPLLLDSEGRVLSMPPIINSEGTKVEPKTKNLFIDITGTDLKTLNQALNIICCSLIDRGAKVEKVIVNNRPTPDTTQKKITIDPIYINRLLGLNMTTTEIARHLAKMGLNATRKTPLTVQVPPYRVDILHPIDIVEDIAIAYGYMKFAPVIGETATIGKSLEKHKRLAAAREIMVGHGFNEVSTFVLTNTDNHFKRMTLPENKLVTIDNPRTSDYTHFRDSLLPSILSVISSNSRYEIPQRFFEIGDIALPDGRNRMHLAAAVVSDRANYSEIRTILESLLRESGMQGFKFKPMDTSSFLKGRAAKLEGKAEAVVGEVHPQVLKNFGIEYPVAVFELRLEQ